MSIKKECRAYTQVFSPPSYCNVRTRHFICSWCNPISRQHHRCVLSRVDRTLMSKIFTAPNPVESRLMTVGINLKVICNGIIFVYFSWYNIYPIEKKFNSECSGAYGVTNAPRTCKRHSCTQ